MTVNYQLVGGSGWTLLFNEAAGDANEKFAPSFRDTVDKVPGYGTPSQVKIPMANTDGNMPFKWSSNYATPAAALASIKTLRTTFKGVSINLQVIEGATTVYFNNATLASSAHDQHGKECMHQLTFDTDDIS
jgi:hypothetical protein